MAYMTNAAEGNIFVLTQKGYLATPDIVKPERTIGKPVFEKLGFDKSVPTSWIKKGYVVETAI